MERATEGQDLLSPPYVTFENLEHVIRHFSLKGVPSNLRAARLPLTDSVRAALLPALHFLGLIDDKDHAQPSLHELADAYGSDDYGPRLRKVLDVAYGGPSRLDLATATPSDVGKLLNSERLAPERARKAIRFYLKAAAQAGLPLGPRLTFGRRARSSMPPATVKKVGSRGEDDILLRRELKKMMPDFDPRWSERTKANWFATIRSISSGR